jgi:hypothetical protein
MIHVRIRRLALGALSLAILLGCLGFEAVDALIGANSRVVWVNTAFIAIAAGASVFASPGLESVPNRWHDLLSSAVASVIWLSSLLALLTILRPAPSAALWLSLLAPTAWLVGRRVGGGLAWYAQSGEPTGPPPSLAPWRRVFVAGAVLLFILTGLAQHQPGAGFALPLYLLVGLLSLTALHYHALRVGWTVQRYQVPVGLARRWLLIAVGSLSIAVLVAALIPFNLVVAGLKGAGSVATHVFTFLAIPVVDLLAQTQYVYHSTPLTPVTGGKGPVRRVHSGSGIGHPSGQSPSHYYHIGVHWLGFSVLTIIVLLAVYLAVAYYRHRQHGIPLRLALLQPIRSVWQRLRAVLGHAIDGALAHLPEPVVGLMPSAPSISRPWKRRTLRQLSPRDQILAYYAATLACARRYGCGRRPSETPLEYEAVLSPQLDDGGQEIERLTTLFNQARYSMSIPNREMADQAHRAYSRLRRSLTEVPARDQPK